MPVIKIQLYLQRAYLWMVLTNSNSSTILFFPDFQLPFDCQFLVPVYPIHPISGTETTPNGAAITPWNFTCYCYASNSQVPLFQVRTSSPFTWTMATGPHFKNFWIPICLHFCPFSPIVTMVVILKNSSSTMNTFRRSPRVYLTSMW